MDGGEVCVYALDILRGSMLGLPVEEKEDSKTTEQAALDLLGYDDVLSNPPTVASASDQRRSKHGMPVAAGRDELRETTAAELACPQETGECRYDCVFLLDRRGQ
eukprot:2831124-Rhodomonas_salina.2